MGLLSMTVKYFPSALNGLLLTRALRMYGYCAFQQGGLFPTWWQYTSNRNTMIGAAMDPELSHSTRKSARLIISCGSLARLGVMHELFPSHGPNAATLLDEAEEWQHNLQS